MADKQDGFHTPASLMEKAQPHSQLGQLGQLVLPGAPPQAPAPAEAKSADPAKAPLSQRTKNRVIRFADAIEARRDEKQTLAFSPQDFILFGLPYKRPKGSVYARRNGKLSFEVLGHPAHGVPFGQDRLLPIWLATAYSVCGQPEDGVIRFRAVRDILSAFDMPPAGSEFRALKSRILRFTHATLFVYDERQSEATAGSERKVIRRYNLIDAVDLWFDRHGRQPNQYTLWQNYITLSRSFAAALREKKMPLDLDTVCALKDRPMALDLYVWQAHRSWELFHLKRDSASVPVFGEEGLLAQFGSQVASEKKARQLLRANQKLVEGVWRSCPNHLTKDGNRLVLRPAEALKNARLALPGVSPRPPVQRLLEASGAAPQEAVAGRVSINRPPAGE